MIHYQKTVKKRVQFSGIGLHSGQQSTVTLKPAKVDTGIQFVRTDVTPNVRIPALNSYVVETRLSTHVAKEGVRVMTVEHIMSALWGLGVDNVVVEVSGPEIPILDGSSHLFSKKIRKAGLKRQSRPRRYFVITKSISVSKDDCYGYLMPHKSQKFSCSIDFEHPKIGRQVYELTLNPQTYYKEISRARTFGFLKDVEMLRKQGLIKGGSLQTAIVLDDEKVMNKDGLRFNNEFVRHKLLDTIGDVALMGVRILGHFVTHKSGHELLYRLVRKALIEECGYLIGVQDDDQTAPVEMFQPLLGAVSA